MRLWISFLLLSIIALPSQGQTLWSRPYEPNQLAIEGIMPDAEDTQGLSGATFITGTVSISPNVEFAAELPYARFVSSVDGEPVSTSVGNPFLGLGFSSTSIPFLLQVGTRIPVAPANRASRLGSSADVGRTPAFHPEEFSLSGLANTRVQVGRNATLRLRTGLEYATFPTPTGDTRARDWRMQYDAQLWREGDRFLTGLTLAGRALLTNPGTTQHHGALSLMAHWERIQPGLLVGTSLNDLLIDGEITPFAGLTLSISYARP